MTREQAQAIFAFWQREGAIVDPRVAVDRLPQVVALACDPSGSIAGVCTAYPAIAEKLGQPMFHYRCCVGGPWRGSSVVMRLFRAAFDILEADARSKDFPCIGVLAELENPRFTQGEMRLAPVWPKLDLTYIGTTLRGLHMRVSYFRGARLKPAPDDSH